MSLSFDTNLLVYATSLDDGPKNSRSTEIIQRLTASETKISGQILSEFLNVTQKKKAITPHRGRSIVTELVSGFTLCEPSLQDRLNASSLAEVRQIQFYDALLISTLARAGVDTLLSEDMGDGDTYSGVTVLNPFNSDNHAQIDAALIE